MAAEEPTIMLVVKATENERDKWEKMDTIQSIGEGSVDGDRRTQKMQERRQKE